MLPEFIVSIDIGSERTAVLVGQTDDDGSLRVIGAAARPSVGVRKGMIVDLENAARCVRLAAEHAARMAGVEIQGVCAGMTGPHIRSFNSRGMVPVPGGRREVTAADVELVTRTARTITIPGDVEILHALAQDFTLDGVRGVRDPVGMAAERLGTEIHIVTGQTVHVENTVKVVERAGYEVVNVVFNALASARAVLTEQEREAGCLLIDMGAGVTSFALYATGCVRASGVLAAGGGNVTNDLAVGLRIPAASAEDVKLRWGLALASMEGADEIVALEAAGTGGAIRRGILAAIVEPRCEEIFGMIKSSICNEPGLRSAGGGVVLTGGAAKLEGLESVAAQVFAMPVRRGRPSRLGGLAEVVSSEGWSAAVGMLLHERDRLAAEQGRSRGRGGLGTMISNLRKIAGSFQP